MIPLEYRLRDKVRLQPAGDAGWRVICEAPLTVLSVNESAARLLRWTERGASVAVLAGKLRLSEERVFDLCETFRRRGLFEVRRASALVPESPESSDPPTVSIIVPTRDRAPALAECLAAVGRLVYPADRLEVIVVDDGSSDPATVARVASAHGARLLVNEVNQGPAYSRNRAAREAAGEIVAFVDSDCVARPAWLQELTPYFWWQRVGAVGGRTRGYYTESRLARYEEVASPLDMGSNLMLEAKGESTFYVPTCNLLVRASVYRELDGLRDDLLVGEDVDFCWRLRARDYYLVYAAEGEVQHKHLERLGPMLRRRAQYGTSEATLHALHRDKRKRFPVAPASTATVALLSAALAGLQPALLPASVVPVLWDGAARLRRLRRNGVSLPAEAVWFSVLRGHLSMMYFVYFHLVRYYLGPLAAAGLVAPGVWALAGFAAVYAGAVDFTTRKPRLDFPTYLALYLAEHAAYQAGVVAGSLREGTFRSYLPATQPSRG